MPVSQYEHRKFPRLYQLAILVTIVAVTIWAHQHHHKARSQWPGLVPVSTPEVHQFSRLKKQDRCHSIITSTQRKFEYNITSECSAVKQWRFQQSARPEAWWNFGGKVSVIRGNKFQSSDIEVWALIKSDDKSDIDNILFNSSESALNLDYSYVAPRRACTEVYLVVFLRPWPRRSLDVLEVRTELLDVTINENLSWEVDSLIAHSSQGTLLYQNSEPNEPLVTHNISVSSSSGDVLGLFPANGNLDIQNKYGRIDFRLVHYNEHFHLESLWVLSWYGHVHIDTALENWPSRPLNHVTTIQSGWGDIKALLPHGSMTRLGTESSIEVRLKTFGTLNPYEANDFATVSREGSSHVYLLGPDAESLDGYYSPFLNMTSHHVANLANLVVRYPDTWYGRIDAEVGRGSTLDFRSEKLHDVERGKGYIKATRGNHGESRFNAWVDEGKMDIQIGYT